MENFYSDCQYEPAELQPLTDELTSVIQRLNPRTQLYLTTQEFHAFCQRAQAQGESIFAACD